MMLLNSSSSMKDENATDSSSDLEPLFVDRLLRCYFSTCFCVGLPLNLMALLMVSIQYRQSSHRRILLLHFHLCTSDIILLVFFCLGKAAWYQTYDWRGPDWLCRFMRYMESFSFAISSNIIVCVAYERAHAVLRPLLHSSGLVFFLLISATKFMNVYNLCEPRRIKLMLACAWTMAGVTAAPQLFVWRLYIFSPTWTQCVTVWSQYVFEWHRERKIMEMTLNSLLLTNSSEENSSLIAAAPGSMPLAVQEWYISRDAYQIFYLVFTFWIPLCVIVTSYTIILFSVSRSLSTQDLATPGSTSDSRKGSSAVSFPRIDGGPRREGRRSRRYSFTQESRRDGRNSLTSSPYFDLNKTIADTAARQTYVANDTGIQDKDALLRKIDNQAASKQLIDHHQKSSSSSSPKIFFPRTPSPLTNIWISDNNTKHIFSPLNDGDGNQQQETFPCKKVISVSTNHNDNNNLDQQDKSKESAGDVNSKTCTVIIRGGGLRGGGNSRPGYLVRQHTVGGTGLAGSVEINAYIPPYSPPDDGNQMIKTRRFAPSPNHSIRSTALLNNHRTSPIQAAFRRQMSCKSFFDTSTGTNHSISTTTPTMTTELRRSGGSVRMQKLRNQTLRTSVLLVTVYIVFWLPYNALSWWDLIDHQSYVANENHVYLLHSLVALNSVLNPFVYGRLTLLPRYIRKYRRSAAASARRRAGGV